MSTHDPKLFYLRRYDEKQQEKEDVRFFFCIIGFGLVIWGLAVYAVLHLLGVCA